MATSKVGSATEERRDDDEEESSGSRSRTTVLPPGTVESRGYGTGGPSKTRSDVSSEIRAFLTGEAKFGPRCELRSFLTVWMFLNRILPSPSWVDLHPGFLMRGMCYFPVAGSILGLILGTILEFGTKSLGLSSSISASVAVGAGLYLTGCFHEDGLADSSDGMGGGWSRSQILRIMTDSRVGTFGAAALSLFLSIKVQLLDELGGGGGGGGGGGEGLFGGGGAASALVVSQTLARLSAPFLIRTRPYVPEVGPKSSFYLFMVEAKHLVSWPRVLFAAAYCFFVASILYGPLVALGLIGAVLAFASAAGRSGQYYLGGVMGDFLGATICLCEILVLSLLAAKESIVDLGRAVVDALMQQSVQKEGAAPPSEILGEMGRALWENERTRALLLFSMTMVSIRVWCSFVGPPDMFDREEEEKDDDSAPTVETGAEEQKTSAPATNEGGEEKEPSPQDTASAVLSSDASTFAERHDAARSCLDALAKPVGSLGSLEEWAARLAALQRTPKPNADRVACLIFAADHGAAAAPDDGGEGCSLYPQAVTRSVLVGLDRGVAGASVLAKANNVDLKVVDVGVNGAPFDGTNAVISSPEKLNKGTRNYCLEPAMTSEECARCVRIGRRNLIQFVGKTSSRVVCLGEVGIGNTTSSSALIAALTEESVENVCGGGAYASKTIDGEAVAKKIKIVKKALALHKRGDGARATSATETLARLGGAEIAALVGAMMEASERDIAVLVDGFIVTAAALVAACISPDVCRVLFLTTNSAERGQRAAIDKIQAIASRNGMPMPVSPALSMGLRMGEGTAALLAVPLLRSAAAILSDMATIADILT